MNDNLTGAACALRLATAEDAAAIAAIYQPYVLHGTASFETAPPGADEIARRMLAGADFPWLAAVAGEQLAGYAYASRLGERAGYDWAAAASIYIEESQRRTGAGRRLYTALCALLAAQGYRTVYGVVALPNPSSERFHTAMGFELQGVLRDVGYKFGQPLSVGYYCRRLLPVAKNPPPPRPFAALGPAEVAAILSGGGSGNG